MAVMKHRKDITEEQLARLSEIESGLEAKLRGEGMEIEGDPSMRSKGEADLRSELSEVKAKIKTLQVSLANEEEKCLIRRDENVRRKHNYIPFMFNFLKFLAEKKQLKPLIEKARQRGEGSGT